MKRAEIEVVWRNTMMHKFNGKEKEKEIKTKSDEEQARKHAYFIDGENSNLCFPSAYIRGCIIEYAIDSAPPKTKRKMEKEITPRITVEPINIDLGIKDYIIDKRAIPIKVGGIIKDMDFCVRPLIPECKTPFIFSTSLDKSNEWLEDLIKNAVREIGVGSGRKLGYGRGEVISFKWLV